ncbi:MAG: hypothetical protein JWR21_46, partial [Herminiimonas sp.]|nr:hypothetical protein [Herminiimonas sp.]
AGSARIISTTRLIGMPSIARQTLPVAGHMGALMPDGFKTLAAIEGVAVKDWVQ